ncbi:aromatic acid exporter family protein [Rugosimonospora acidiphila]|uniref:Aromatic acid exporter family protein n=1 Tax=Rugosimonospora acidiphila TaxID=556531 RepID=A0ABP9RIR2_9ACTN
MHTTVEALTELRQRSRADLSDRWRRLRGSLLFAAQAGVAASLAWLAAHYLVRHPHPYFAPIAAVIVLNVSVGQRLRRAVELLAGVALGILLGDLLIYFTGTGPWQIGVSVAFVILACVFLGGSPTVIGQAASSAVLVSTLAPPQSGIYYSRFIDAVVGGVVGVLVLALLLQINPLTVMKRAAAPAFDCLAEGLRDCARALASGSLEQAQAALNALSDADSSITRFQDALADARETATLAPVRWRARVPLTEYVDAAPHIDHALRNARVLARRTVTMIEDGEEASPNLIASLQSAAEAVAVFVRELAAGREPDRTRELTLAAVALAGEAYRRGLDFSAGVVAAQVRTIGTDLMLATGVSDRATARLIHRAAGRVPRPSRSAG